MSRNTSHVSLTATSARQQRRLLERNAVKFYLAIRQGLTADGSKSARLMARFEGNGVE
jgi:hypothetical protein